MAATRLTYEVKINIPEIADKLDKLLVDDTTMLEVHQEFAKTIDPWVPYLNNPLSTTLDITPECVNYIVPYARRQYFGVDFHHTTENHPLASAKWDEVAMQTQLDSFTEEVKKILIRRANELYG